MTASSEDFNEYICFYQQIMCEFLQLKLLVCLFETWRAVCSKTSLLTLLLFYKSDWCHQFKICTDIISMDRPGKLYRFTILYYLLSVMYNTRLVVYIQISSLQHVLSITTLYRSAKWSEREIWDLFGILFLSHPDLRRLLSDYGFNGFPLRKDFPLTGYCELFYSDNLKSLVYTKLELAQDMRMSSITLPWAIKNN